MNDFIRICTRRDEIKSCFSAIIDMITLKWYDTRTSMSVGDADYGKW